MPASFSPAPDHVYLKPVPASRNAWIASSWRLPVASGVLLPLAHYGALLIPNFIAFVPMLFWLDARRGRPKRELARGAAVFGLVAYGIGLHWIHAMLSISYLAVLMYLALLIELTLGAMLALTLAAWLRARTNWSWAWLLPVVWIPSEWVRTWTDLRLTVDHVSHGLAKFPFIVQFADLFGPYGVGIWLLAVNALVYECIATRRGRNERAVTGKNRPALVLVGLVAVVLAYDAWSWTHPPEATSKLRVAIIQPNIPLSMKWDPAEDMRQEVRLAELTRRAAAEKPDLIVWPESARPKSIRHIVSDPRTLHMPEVQRLAVDAGADILAGVEYWRIRTPEDRDFYNAALVAKRDGTIDDVWSAKRDLVPFTEGVPFRNLLGPLVEGRGGAFQWLSGGFTPGPDVVPLPAAGKKVGVLVCYEEFYFDLSRRLRAAGADLQVVITNDAWFGRTVFQSLMADVIRMRAIETRSAIVRVANTGISGFVDPLGRYEGRTDLFVEAVEVQEVPITTGKTLYVRIGDAAAWAAILGLSLTLLRAARNKPNRASSHQ